MNTNTPAALPARVREVLADAAPYLSEVRGGEALLAALADFAGPLAREEGGDALGVAFALAEGLYWYAVGNYRGERDPLYSLAGALGFRPGVLARGPEEGSLAEEVHALAAEFLRVSR